MSLLTLLVVITVVGVVVGLVITYVPMPPPFKNMLVIVAIVALLFLCLRAFGVLPELRSVRL